MPVGAWQGPSHRPGFPGVRSRRTPFPHLPRRGLDCRGSQQTAGALFHPSGTHPHRPPSTFPGAPWRNPPGDFCIKPGLKQAPAAFIIEEEAPAKAGAETGKQGGKTAMHRILEQVCAIAERERAGTVPEPSRPWALWWGRLISWGGSAAAGTRTGRALKCCSWTAWTGSMISSAGFCCWDSGRAVFV